MTRRLPDTRRSAELALLTAEGLDAGALALRTSLVRHDELGRVGGSFDRTARRAAGAVGSTSTTPTGAAVVDLAAPLAVRTLAEGAETADELAAPASPGGGCVQGYVLGRPRHEPVLRVRALG